MDEPSLDDLVTDQLVEYQQRLDAGAASSVGAVEGPLPEEICDRVRAAQECLDLLHRVQQARQHNSVLASLQTQPFRGPVRPDHEAEIQLPRQIGRFEIRARLGVGGFGIVYRAFDPETRREVALKVPRPEALTNHDLLERFLQEAKAAARLEHPNIVTVLESGHAGVVPIIVSAFYDAPTLATWLTAQAGAVPARCAAETVMALADAVQHAHQRGVLHRDIKPSNVLMVNLVGESEPDVARASVDWTPKLMDFGLAKVTDATLDLTQTGAMLGTLMYMPPEQATGNLAQVGPRSDVYGLGAILYEMLTDQPPLRGSSQVETLRRVMQDVPAALRTIRADVPRDLETICLKCLEKEPARRYASARALAGDLRRYLAGEPILARPATPTERVVKWCRRNPQWASLIGVVCLATFSLLGFLTYSNARISDALDAEQATRHELQIQVYAADMRRAGEAIELNDAQQAIDLLQSYAMPIDGQDYRELAWHLLSNSLYRHQQRLPQHPTDIYRMALSPDSQRLATACRDGFVRVWHLADSQLLQELPCDGSQVTEVAFSANGAWLAAGAEDGIVRLWSTDDWKLAARLTAGGIITTDITGLQDRIHDVALQADGKIVVAGFVHSHGSDNLAVARYLDDGTLDDRFGRDGSTVMKWIPDHDSAHALAIQPDGKIVCVGSFERSQRVLIARFDTDGRIDGTFGEDGVQANSLLGERECFHAVALQADQKIVAAGFVDNKGDLNFAVARYDLGGAFDPSFGNGSGWVDTDAGSTADVVDDLVIQPDGKIVVAGETGTGDARNIAVARYLTDGALDSTFGDDGIQTLALSSEPTFCGRLALQADGKILVAGLAGATANTLVVARLESKGTLDVSFGDRGRSQFPCTQGALDAIALAFQADGKLLLAGTCELGPQQYSIVLRANADGSLDRGFGVGGYLAESQEQATPVINALAIQPDGRIVAGGYAATDDPTEENFRLVRFNPDGSLDTNFNIGGVTGLAFSPDSRRLYASSNQLVTAWDVASHTPVGRWATPVGDIHYLAVAPDGDQLGVATRSEGYVWNLRDSATAPACLNAIGDGVSSLSFAPDGTVVSGHEDGSIRYWQDIKTDQWTELATKHSSRIDVLRPSPDGRFLVSTCRDGVVQVHRTDRWTTCAQFVNPSGRQWDAHYRANTNTVIACDVTGLVNEWPLPQHSQTVRPDGGIKLYSSPVGIDSLELSSNDARVAVATIQGEIAVIDTTTFNELLCQVFHPVAVRLAAFMNEDTELLAVHADGHMLAIDLASQQVSDTWQLPVEVRDCVLSPQQDQLAVACENNHVVELYSWPALQLRHKFKSENTSSHLEFSHSGNELIMACPSQLEVRDTRTGAMLGRVGQSGDSYLDVALFADGKQMIVAEAHGGAAVREFPTGKLLFRLIHPGADVIRAGVSPDSRNVVTLGKESQLRIFDLPTRQPLLSLRDNLASVFGCGVYFSRDGRKLFAVTSSSNFVEQLVLWSTQSQSKPQPTLPRNATSLAPPNS